MPLAEDNDMVKTIPSDRTDEPLRMSVLPWRSWCDRPSFRPRTTGKAFEAKYPGIAVRVERSGAERIFQRIGQEQASRIYAVDVVCSTDPAHFLDWKSKDWVAPYVPEDVSKYFPPEHVDPGGMHATLCAWLEVIGYNTESRRARGMPRRAMPTCLTLSCGASS